MAFTPFDAMLFQEGIRRGYTPIQMAAAVGNRRAESGGNPLGAIGDTNLGPGQEAFGAFQWRNDRQRALRTLGDVSQPQTHINHFFNELDGSEKSAGQALRQAQDLATANDAMRKMLRYRDDPGKFEQRLSYAQEAAKTFGDGSNIGEPQDSPRDPRLPSGVQTEANAQAQGQQGQSGGFNWDAAGKVGNGLIKFGAALAAINSPTQSAALSKLIDDKPQEDYQTTINQETGQIIRVNKQTGAVQVISNPEVAKASAELSRRKLEDQMKMFGFKQDLKPPSEKYTNDTQATWKEAGAAQEIGSRLDRVIDGLDRGVLKPDILSRAKDAFGSIANMSTEERMKRFGVSEEGALLLSELDTLKNAALLKTQLQQKGVQTEGDAVRITNSMFGNLDMTDPVKLRGSLGMLSTQLGDSYKRYADEYSARIKRFEKDPTLNDPNILGSLESGRTFFDRMRAREEEYRKRIQESSKTQAAPTNVPRTPLDEIFKR